MDDGTLTRFEPGSVDFEARVRDSFAKQGAMTTIGAELARVEPGHVDIRVPYVDGLSQQHGFFHGGVVSMIADSAGGYAAFSLFGSDDGILTVEFKVNLAAPADGEFIIARGRVIRPGRTLTVATADVFAVKDGEEKLCAVMQQTLMRITGRADVVG